jgi:translocator protein
VMHISSIIIVICVFTVAVAGSLFTSAGMAWYKCSHLPALAPPGSVIGAAWTVIYALSAISLIVWFSQPSRDPAFWLVVWVFILNGVLNVAWCWLFFYSRWVLGSLLEMLLLEATVILLIGLIWPVRLASALLLIPYALWVAFATYLTFEFWRLNKA